MPIYLDDAILTVPHESLAGAIEAARLAADARGRVVVEAHLDGRAMSEDDLLTPATQPLGASELRFISAEPRSLVTTTLLDLKDVLDRVTSVQADAAEALRVGDFKVGFEHLSEALSVWDMARRAVSDGPALLGLDVRTMVVHVDGRDAQVARHIEFLSGHLQAVKDALGIQDWSALADLLSGELQDQAGAWREMLADLAGQIRRGAKGTGGGTVT